jgi:putative ABC transport system permease protein
VAFCAGGAGGGWHCISDRQRSGREGGGGQSGQESQERMNLRRNVGGGEIDIIKCWQMIKNYFISAWRNTRKNKLFSAINIFGLSIGVALCFIIMLYVQHEMSYDRFNKNADRIVRVVFNASINGGKVNEGGVMAPVAATIKRDYPEVQETGRIQSVGLSKTFYNTKVFRDNGFFFADPGILSIFTIPFISGDPKTALNEVNSVIITKTAAGKIFGKEDPMGKLIGLNSDSNLFKITGVVKDIPENSHFHFDMLGSMISFDQAKSNSWMEGVFHTYLLLKPGADYKRLQAKFPDMVQKYMGPQIQQEMGLSLAQFRSKGNDLGLSLQPLTDIHLNSYTTTEFEPGGTKSYVYMFGAIGLFMLLVACINFINLSTAGASKRAKEVGVRKAIGSGRFQLVKQFLAESLFITVISLAIAAVFVEIGLPVFNGISGKQLTFGPQPILVFVASGLLVGLMAGIYPAFYLSSFRPIAVLKGKLTVDRNSFGLRGGLVIFQFFISVGLIVGTIVVYRQMQYIQNKDLGYDKEHLLTIQNSYALGKNEQSYKQHFLNDPRIENATASYYRPAGPSNTNNALAYPEGQDKQAMKTVAFHVDEQYIPTFGMQMAAGRNFSKDFPTDSLGMIINESAARAFGFGTMNAVGKKIISVNSDRGANVAYDVVGVVKDFNFTSLHNSISPLLMVLEPEGGLIFKIKTTNLPGLLADMKKQWNAYNTGEPFSYAFMDDLFDKTYAAEQKTGTILDIFAVLTIFVACLGLFGLATYTAEQRTKEIGIRKVLGASVAQVTQLLSAEFLKLVLIASLIAFPVSWWAMNKWLQSFAYRISISWWIFAVAGLTALFIALFTVIFQAIRAALANPVKSLRSE